MTTLRQFLYEKPKSEIDQYFEDQAKFYIEKQKLERIDNFNGYFDFLNNEFPCEVYYDGIIFRSVSHGYQAARSSETHIREKIARADTIMEMYEIAAKIEDPPEWQNNRLKVMEMLIRDKFRRNTELREKLRATEMRELLNTFNDASVSNLFWGVVDGKGQNQLGRILEHVRNDVHHNLELEKWLLVTFHLEEDPHLRPFISLDVYKAGEKIETTKMKGKNHFFLGKLNGSDVLMTHQSISRRHAAIICDSKLGICLVDLGSKCGSFVNDEKAQNCFPHKLKTGDQLSFGASTRRYTIAIDFSGVQRYLDQKSRALEKDLKILDKLNDPDADIDIVKASLGLIAEDTVFVAGLPENPSFKEVENFFAQFGKIRQTRIPVDKHTGKNRSIAFITFYDEKDGKAAMKNDGIIFKGKRLKINLAEKRNADQLLEDKIYQSEKEKYKDQIKKNEKRAYDDVEKRYRRRERSRSRSRSRDHKRKHRKETSHKKHSSRRDKDKERRRKREKSSSSDSSSSDESSKSRSRSKDKVKHNKVDKPEKESKNEKKKEEKPLDKKIEPKKPAKESEGSSSSDSSDSGSDSDSSPSQGK